MFTHTWTQSASPNSLDNGVTAHHMFPQSPPQGEYLYKLEYGYELNQQLLSIAASMFTRSWPPGVSPNMLHHSLQVYLQTSTIMADRFATLQHPTASLVSLQQGLRVHRLVHSITASKCTSKLTQSLPQRVSLSSLDYSMAEMLLLNGTPSITNTPPHLAWHPKRILWMNGSTQWSIGSE